MRFPLSLKYSFLCTIVGAIMLALTAEPYKISWLLLPGLSLIVISVFGQKFKHSLFISFISGIIYWFMLILWVNQYLGLFPYIALSFLMAVYWAIAMVLISFFTRKLIHKYSTRPEITVFLSSLLIPSIWLIKETISANFPFGGFAWGRVAHLTIDTKISLLAGFVGISGLSFLYVSFATFCAMIIVFWSQLKDKIKNYSVIFIILIFVSSNFISQYKTPNYGSLRVSGVQGNSDSAIFGDSELGDVLNDHLEVSEDLVKGKQDIVVWPEGAPDLSPDYNEYSREELSKLSKRLDVPILIVPITEKNEKYFRSSVLWEGTGYSQKYDKKHLVPFGEYVPIRDFLYLLAPDLVSLIPNDLTHGRGDQTINFADNKIGILICFDVVDDNLINNLVQEEASWILVQSNNADFGRTIESEQQLDITRMQAIASGKYVFNVSTMSNSAVVKPDGKVIQQIGMKESGIINEKIYYKKDKLPSYYLGPLFVWFSFVFLLIYSVSFRRPRLFLI